MSIETAVTQQRPVRFPHRRNISKASIPPLEAGDRLSRVKFERYYEAHPEIKKAELVEGVVQLPSPVHFKEHGEPHAWVVGWLTVYVAATPQVRLGDNTTVRLDLENEVQPDAFLRLEPTHGGQSRVTVDDYLEGPPELVVEVTGSRASFDLNAKKRVYQRCGVQEYLALQIYEERVDWFVLREDVFDTLTPDAEGVVRSEAFPGLWLQPESLWSGDLATMLAVLQHGIGSDQHAAFVARLDR